MTTPIFCLVLFASWGLLLVAILGCWRVADVLRRKTPPNGFNSGTKHGGDRYWRLNRAHMNTLENLPIFATLVLAGHVSGMTTALFSQLAVAVIVGRIGQTMAHIASNSNMVVNVRFAFFLTQVVAMAGMAGSLLRLVATA